MSENSAPMSLPRSVPVPIQIPTITKTVSNDQYQLSPTLENRYQYELDADMFDPYSSSPPQKFMMKLKERIHAYDSTPLVSAWTNALIRTSE
jgi:hypothetical protein